MKNTKIRRKVSAKVREQRSGENARYYAKVKEARVQMRLAEGLTPLGRLKARVDLKGRVIGDLTVEEYAGTVGEPGSRKAMWWVQCRCGSPRFQLRAEQLMRTYPRRHCGCGARRDRAELVGAVRGKLTVLRIEHPASEEPGPERKTLKGKENYRVLWRCQCACGREIVLRTNQLREEDGRTCCGCELKTPLGHPRKLKGMEGVGYLARRAAGEVKEVRKKRPAGDGSVGSEWPEQEKRGRRLAALATAVRTGTRLIDQEAARPVAGEMDAAGWLKLLVLMKRGGAAWADLEMELGEAAGKGVTQGMVEEEMRRK